MTFVIDPYRFGVSTWTYASLSAAEASGDPWADGNTIVITGGATFLYKSALAVSGYSGLIHAEPYGSGNGDVSSIDTIIHNEAEGVDPDSWTGFTDASSGVKSTDYDFTVVSGRAKFADLTADGRAQLGSGTLTSASSAYDEVFFIVDRLTADESNTDTAQVFCNLIQIAAYKDASNCVYARIDQDKLSTDVWRIEHTSSGTWADSTQSTTSESRAFIYLKDGRLTYWVDGESTPQVNVTTPRTLAHRTMLNFNTGIVGTNSDNAWMELGRFVLGSMTTS